MKTLLVFELCVALFLSMVAHAADRSAVMPRVTASRLCYPMRDWVTPPFGPAIKAEMPAQPKSHPVSIAALHLLITDGVVVPDAAASGDCFSFALPLSPQRRMEDRAKISLPNLLEGSLYDFKKKNDLRFVVGSPMCESREKSSLLQYEEPFCLTFLLRFKM